MRKSLMIALVGVLSAGMLVNAQSATVPSAPSAPTSPHATPPGGPPSSAGHGFKSLSPRRQAETKHFFERIVDLGTKGWALAGYSGKGFALIIVMVDLHSINGSNVKRAWTAIEFEDPKGAYQGMGPSMSESKAYVEFDCHADTMRILQETAYDDTENPIHTFGADSPEYVIPGSVGANELTLVCHYHQPKNASHRR